MAITWKKRGNLKPEVLFDRIAAVRNVTSDGRVSFTGFDLDDVLPALESMLDFGSASSYMEQSTLIWRALRNVTDTLMTPEAFLAAMNNALRKELATRETDFFVLTALSISPGTLPQRTKYDSCQLTLFKDSYPRKFRKREASIAELNVPVLPTPQAYCKAIVSIRAKSPYRAATEALRSLDIHRAILCLLCNPVMEIVGQEWIPINRIRLSSAHTVHYLDGSLATEELWFEPNFVPAAVYRTTKIDSLRRASGKSMQRLSRSPYDLKLTEALLRYVRALDDSDQNNAFVRLWSAIELLASPDVANYDKIIRRCSFLFKDRGYHQQILEHLRESRNSSIHAGDQSANAKTRCFQLQMYFSHLVWFHLRNGTFFKDLEEANSFLDLDPDRVHLLRKKAILDKALRFVG